VNNSAGVAVAAMPPATDVNPIRGYLDRVVYLAHGGAVAGTPEQVVTGATLSRLYGTPIEVPRTSDQRLVVVGGPDTPIGGVHSGGSGVVG
jgi:zinc/manganese transport system ATP-binding protein